MSVQERAGSVTLGPVLFNWQPEKWRDFYFRIADEVPVSTVYIGETVCSKRAPLIEPYYQEVAERLAAAGKAVVFSSLSEVVSRLDRKLAEQICTAADDFLVEANDGSALLHLKGRPHHIGPLMNVYNERTVAFLVGNGAQNVCLPVEMPASAVAALCQATRELATSIEVQVFGRQSLALSARCYHARAHGRTKDSCRFVCEEDPDGLELITLDDRKFLTVNGIQTLSYEYLNLVQEIPDLKATGVSRFRLSPHSCDMVRVATAFRSVLDGVLTVGEALACLEELPLDAPFSNGFHHGRPGYGWSAPDASIGP